MGKENRKKKIKSERKDKNREKRLNQRENREKQMEKNEKGKNRQKQSTAHNHLIIKQIKAV